MHLPVLLNEVIKLLDPKENENYIDATLGEGGHTLALLQKTSPAGKVLGIDLDPETLEIAHRKLQAFGDRLVLANDNFKNLEEIIDDKKFKEISGIVFDFGMSSRDIDESGRGFSFLKDEPLLMNFGSDAMLTAENIVNGWPESELEKIFSLYGEEKFARQIAKGIIARRIVKPIKTTFDLVEVIEKATPNFYHHGRIHPATRTFQALRIAVNDELNSIQKGLEASLKILSSGAKIAVISFHSLEDRIVKNFFRDNKNTLKILTKKPVVPAQVEILNNPRARSAKLRVAQKI
ncbi:MAG TPA: 16S rRNA (cytosine(1402)-N(4))-methyltransferase RsmH [Candidatus Paceibacterota bacterium]|nr:16S rRNA (cytosine(1402)-N(4))-methyltransferase RsmH [Candidatus Paceibacterota bacterium]HPT40269.1 16S rRNA (cytosine(1402)-N(4))-methyltransferase RsmH [Candidatus Paceibacterota bacterium]